MVRIRFDIVWYVLALSGAASGQSAPAFQNVDIHAAGPTGRAQAIGRFRPGTRFEADGFTMLDLIERAYGVSDRDWIVGGPAWLGIDKFDIVAEVPAGVAQAAAQPMLRAMLAERFSLAIHNDRKPMPVYALAAGKKPLLKETAGGESSCGASGWEVTTMVCTNMSMEQFAQELHQSAYGYFDRPLVDRTGLTGRYDFTLHWTPFNQLGVRNADGQPADTGAFQAVDAQLGLKIERREEPVPVLVVDHVNRTPTPNAAGVSEALRAPALTEFEVAEVHAHKPETPFKFGTYGDRAEMFGLNLRNLIGEAYGVRGEQLAGPKWIDTETFDLIAKSARRVPWEAMQVMLQNLIEDRFKLTFHSEDRPITSYGLTVGKGTPKLTKADPNGRSDCRRALANGSVTFTCSNTTMTQFAEKARPLTGDSPALPVADLTGLAGGFDFAVTWSPAAKAATPGRGGDVSQPADASTPTGELTFAEAVEKQLGLKLQQGKHPMPVMVLDRVERPVEK